LQILVVGHLEVARLHGERHGRVLVGVVDEGQRHGRVLLGVVDEVGARGVFILRLLDAVSLLDRRQIERRTEPSFPAPLVDMITKRWTKTRAGVTVSRKERRIGGGTQLTVVERRE
jgi:hypothetical protein